MAKIDEAADPAWALLLDGWEASLRGARKADETLGAYRKAATALVNWLTRLPAPPAGWAPPRGAAAGRAARAAAAAAGAGRAALYRPAGPEDITRAHLEAFFAAAATTPTPRCPTGLSDSTLNQWHRSLQQFFGWLVEEEELEHSPLERLGPPKIGEKARPTLEVADLTALVGACKGRGGFAERRDEAIIRMLADTGGRRAEVAAVLLDDLDSRRQRVKLRGKGNKERVVGIGNNTMRALNRYLRVRARHKGAGLPQLWLGTQTASPLTPNGLYQMLERRGAQAGVKVHPHMFRYTLTNDWIDAGGGEGTLMDHMGWESPAMPRRYGSHGRQQRAQNEHGRLGLGDRF